MVYLSVSYFTFWNIHFIILTPSLGQKVEHSQNLSSSEPKSVQESKGHVTHEHEGITVRFLRELPSALMTKHKVYNDNEFIDGS